MKYLLDVNALVAALYPASPHHSGFNTWASRRKPVELATCAITELGFVRVANAALGFSVDDGKQLLTAFRASGVGYVESLPAPCLHLPGWATRHAHTTDAYLCAVAKQHGLQLLTFDQGFQIPWRFISK